jgi:hypothetical protein
MWFLRRRRKPDPVVLPSLEHVSELVDRVVSLLEQPLRPSPPPSAPPPPPPASPPARVEAAAPPELAATERHVLFVASPSGYRLVEREGAAPGRGSEVDVDGRRYRSVRVGPSPLPGDRRRCAFLETEEPPGAPRTSHP